MSVSLIKEFVEAHLLETQYKSMSDLKVVDATLRVDTIGENKPTVPDILTNMRAAPDIVVVKQIGAIRRSRKGREELDIEIKILPDKENFIEDMGKAIRRIVGVDFVIIKSLNGKPVRTESGARKVF